MSWAGEWIKRSKWWERESFPYAFKSEDVTEPDLPPGTPPQEEVIVNPPDVMLDILENKNLVFQIFLIGAGLRLARMEGGMKTIQVLGKAAIDGIFKTTNSLGKASAANYIAAWANPVLISGIMERFGFLPPRFNRGYHDAISKLVGLDVVKGLIEVLFGKEGQFPSNIDFGSEGGPMLMEALKAEQAGAAAAPVVVP